MTPEKIAEFAGNVRSRDDVIEAIKSAVAAEREACASLAESPALVLQTPRTIAACIRARTNT